MPVSKSNLETLVKLLAGLAQRQDQVNRLVSQLYSGALWRSPDGSLVLEISPEERAQLEAFVKAYLEESQTIIDNARTFLGGVA